ncbi:MAG: iron-sulfur cluster carrier protein ApbC [Magnetococcales bacterium]|nr:iron-sulfur cluster carrier protein ApbC [Magnetococcales bacterium]
MSHVQEQHILDALKQIIDPDLKKDIVTLGFVKNLTIDGTTVSFSIELTTPACPVKEQFRQQAQTLVSALDGVETVNVEMTAQVQGGKQATELLPHVKNVIAVASGKGGVGKSTTAVNLALALSRMGASVGIMDADIYGPSLPRMLNITERPNPDEVGEKGKGVEPIMAHGLKAISMGLFVPEEAPMVWRGPMVGMAVEQLLRDIEWGELDYLIIDLPPGTGDAQLTLTQKVPLTGVVIISTPQDVALLDVKKGINMFKKVNAPVLGVVENMSYYLCPDCGHRAEIFSHGGARKQAEADGIEFLGELPLDEKICKDADSGNPTMVSDPDGLQGKRYQEIASKIAAKVATLRHNEQAFPKIVVE